MKVGQVYGILLLGFALLAAGCNSDIDTAYGRRSGAEGGPSVNGTRVLFEMFAKAGHQVSSAGTLTPRLAERAEVIVWFPDDFQPPKEEVRTWFDDWLCGGPGRALIYVGRDFDAAPVYWTQVQAGAPANELPELKRRAGTAATAFLAERPAVTTDEDCDWFVFKPARKPRDIRTLEGRSAWLTDLDPSKVEIELNGRLVPPDHAEVWLSSNSDALVSSQEVCDSRLILVANGSFLLNLPLVNHEHRKLAGHLIEEVGQGRKVVFVQSSAGGPKIDNQEHKEKSSGIYGYPPFDVIFLQLSVAGVIFCCARFPIFGLPRPWVELHQSDFGRHVWALGKLLAKTGQPDYALSRLEHYRQTLKHETPRHEPGQRPKPSPISPPSKSKADR